jgi:serine protease
MSSRALLAVATVLCLAFGNARALTTTGNEPADSARVIVKFRADAPTLRSPALTASGRSITRALELARRQNLAVTVGEAMSDRMQVVFSTGLSSTELARRLAADADVEYAVPDQRRTRHAAPNDPLYANGVLGNGPAVGQWYLRAPVGDAKSSIDAEIAWSVTQGSPAIVVAVLDTGVRFEHPDLLQVTQGGNLLPGYDMVSDVAVANDGDGRDADPSDPGDWVTQTEAGNSKGPFYECTVENSSWHGTQTAGLVGALTNNGIGMASIGRTVRVLPVRVLGKCGGFDSDIIAGMRWAAGLTVPGAPANVNRAQVINMSLGGDGACGQDYLDALAEIAAAGTVVVASAGNSSGHAVGVPANCSGVVAVGGLRHFGTKVGFSDLGPEIVVSAPAGNCVNTAAGTACLYPILTTANTGATVPVASTYTDSYNPSLGTSFSAPLVAGTAALMLSARPTLTPVQVRQILQATASPFPTSGSFNTDGSPIPACTAPRTDAQGNPVDQYECYCGTSTCGAGMLNAGAAVQAASVGMPGSDVQAQGLWWNSPANSESGWGINFAQQGDVIFATWFTYDASGKAWWLSMTATRSAANTYSGTLYQTRGPAFNATPFNGALVTSAAVGDATLTFSDTNNGSFRYTVNGITQTKTITRELYGTAPTCVFGVHPRLAAATNYQDLWWNAPAGSESGWGLNITQQSDVIFATWFTYDIDGSPVWFSGTATSNGAGGYSGPLYRAAGPAFNAVPFSPSAVKLTQVGTFFLSFADGNAGTFSYSVNGVAQSKSITRQVFRTPGTMCR